ncbi:uncharacterized protein LOC143233200 [Tachypleus tridentatus]|uniref:uncharacterized protein LOC143233200 n=1 Tax=Tachypleus tridentatus TaxID=6853 RepID=UPI003FD36C4A
MPRLQPDKKEMQSRIFTLIYIFLLTQLTRVSLSTDTFQHLNTAEKEHFAYLKESSNGTLVAEYEWRVTDISILLLASASVQGYTIPGPEFYTGQPGYKVRLSLTTSRINPSDGLPYLGVWFTLVKGKFDDVMEWPFQYKFNLTLVDQSFSQAPKHVDISISPMTAICRLLKQFLRPKHKKIDGHGCGKAHFVPHYKLLNHSNYVVSDSILLRVTIFLEDRGAIPKPAKAFMRGHQLVSEFMWEIENIDQKIQEAKEGISISLTSDLFYVNSESYLMVLQLTINPVDQYLGLFATLVPGDFDDSLDWPFAYTYELSIVDQSSGFLTIDRKGIVDPTSGMCPLSAFTKPQYQPNEPCGFRRLISFQLLQTRNFRKNGNIIMKFTGILDQIPNFASVSVKDSNLVAEYTWKIPNIERKFQLGRSGRLTNLLSERFYTTDQGYLMQLQLKVQNETEGYIGLYLTILEGEYDSLLDWPFSKKYELVVVDQQPSGVSEDIVVSVDAKNPYITNEACVGSFWRPVGRNDGCGSSHTVNYDTLYSRKYIRYGALLVKVIIFLEEIAPPRVATISEKNGNLVAEYEWVVKKINEIMLDTEDKSQFIDSEKFYITNNGYRMMLRLYPQKTPGFLGFYAVLVKGIYDEELEWPFKYTYQLTVVDKTNDGRHMDITRTTYPSTTSSGCPETAFMKPTQDLAEWSCGEGKMISHSTLSSRKYIKNDTLRVKITVFLKELTKNIASTSFVQNAVVAEYSWLVEGILDQIILLKSKELTKLESPLFYTSNQGYAMKASLTLNSHLPTLYSVSSQTDYGLGLYMTLYRGSFDALLRWPFHHTVLLTIVDQSYKGLDVVKIIDPKNTKCPLQAFQRPSEIHNDHSCGFEEVMPLKNVENFIKDDSLLIKASILVGQIYP